MKTPLPLRIAQSVIVVIGASIVCMSRIYLRYHTPRQVLIGVGIGAILGVAWYITVIILRTIGVVEYVLHLRVVELLWFKDGDIGSLEHDLHKEWVEWRQQRESEGGIKVREGKKKR
jgi:dolichyldiphosphatase